MNIKARIKHFQDKRSWSLNHLAMEADLSYGTAQNWFKRNSVPSVDCIEKLCRAFGISLSEFFNEGDKPPKYLSDVQKEYLDEFDLLDPREKEDIIRLIKTRNEKMRDWN